MIKLVLGCGSRNYGSNFKHYDGGDFAHTDGRDITSLLYADNSVDLIYASHVLEYFDREEVIMLLNEWKRALKPNGVLRLAVPDFAAMSKLYVQDIYGLNSFLGPLYGKMKMGNKTIYHKTVYDFMSLKVLLTEIGFKKIRQYNWQDTEHSHIDDQSQAYLPKMDKKKGILISLNTECNK